MSEISGTLADSAIPVTVVIPTFNAGEYLQEAVESVLNQSYTNWKMIIIDDASTDNSLDTLRGYLDDARIRLVQNPENLGQTKCLNIALEKVTTPFMVQLDSDDWFYPTTLETLVTEADHIDSGTALISGNIKLVWQDSVGKIVKTRTRYGREFSRPYAFMRTGQSCWPRFYRTDAIRAVGGWPVDGPYDGRYVEDMRILYRLIPHYRFHWINQTLYMHRRHKHNMTRQVQAMRRTVYWLISDTLKRWGDKYTPKYTLTKSGYPRLTALVPKRTRTKAPQPSSNKLEIRFQLTPDQSVKGLSRQVIKKSSRRPVNDSSGEARNNLSKTPRRISKSRESIPKTKRMKR